MEGYSIFSVCMNRNNQLEQSLPTWLNAKPNEIVIVDWGSQPPIKPIIDKYKNNITQIRLIIVTNVDKWILTKSFNLAARFTKYKYVLKLDCDSLLKEDFFSYHNLQKGSVFFAGDWTKARNNNEMHTNGVVYMKWSDFHAVGYYNEYITTYGYDDCDLYKRLEKRAKRLLVNLDTIQHIEHSNQERLINQTLSYNYRLDIEIEKNRLISEMGLWTSPYELSAYTIGKINDCEYYAKITKSVTLSDNLRESALIQAVKNREWTINSNKSQKKLYINVKNGLGNRLRALASAYNIAKATDRQLILIWIPDYHCNAKFTQLYKINYLFKGITIIENEDNIDIIDAIEYKVGENEYIIGDKIIYNYIRFNGKYIDDTTQHNIYVISACILNNKHTDWNKQCDFLKRLEPIDEIASQIYTFETKHPMTEIIGMHIRMGQCVETAKYEDISAYSASARASVTKWRNSSHYTTFLIEMDSILKDNPRQIFFLCSDNAEAYETILNLKKYDNNIIYMQKNVYDRSLEQIKGAVIDITLLSKTKYILGSNWSSFTEIVSRLSGKKTKLAGIDF